MHAEDSIAVYNYIATIGRFPIAVFNYMDLIGSFLCSYTCTAMEDSIAISYYTYIYICNIYI